MTPTWALRATGTSRRQTSGARRLRCAFERLVQRGGLSVVYHPAYRLPLSGLEHAAGMEPRRAEFAVWTLRALGALSAEGLIRPQPISYPQLALVHTHEYLETLSQTDVLARIFAAAPSEIPVDELLLSARAGCGGTLHAARHSLITRSAVLNMLGGFHHAAPGRGGGFCALNDVAVAIAVLRKEGFSGRIAVLDLDAHPPDGTAECLRDAPDVWIGSLSASNWGPSPSVDEIFLPEGCRDVEYLRSLEKLLRRMPKPELAFVNAGGDVLAGDRFGLCALTLEGARQRDVRVLQALRRIPSVWTPGGGYQPKAWRVLVGTGFVLSRRPRAQIPENYDPLSVQFQDIAASLDDATLNGHSFITQRELDDLVAKRVPITPTLLGFYSKEGLEYGLFRYGVTPHIERLGYRNLQLKLDITVGGDRVRLYGEADGKEHLLLESLLERRQIGAEEFLFVNWLALRDPRAQFTDLRPRLPGQDVPGLGLAREITQLLIIVARRMGLKGVAFRPSWFHLAYAARYRGRFLNPLRQGRFEGLLRDLARLSLLEATTAVAEGRIHLNDQPYQWEADEMVFGLSETSKDEAAVAQARDSSHFTLQK